MVDFSLGGALFKPHFDQVELRFMSANKALQQDKTAAFSEFQQVAGVLDLLVNERHDILIDGLAAGTSTIQPGAHSG